MDRTTALNRLRSMVASDVAPVLDEDTLLVILDEAAVTDIAGNPPVNGDGAGTWTASTAVLPGTVIVAGDRYWIAALGGTTAATEPSWPDLSGIAVSPTRTISDGGVRWVDNGTTWAPTWDPDPCRDARMERKAAAASAMYDFAADDERFSRADRRELPGPSGPVPPSAVGHDEGRVVTLTDAELDSMRATADEALPDECTITRASATAATFDPVTGTYTSGTPTTVYAGPCRLRPVGRSGRTEDQGDVLVAVERWTLTSPPPSQRSSSATSWRSPRHRTPTSRPVPSG